MCIAAHPDDEDGTTLTVLRRKYGVHTVSLFSTYGEGGQNAIGPQLYEELGVIRAEETKRAALIQGSEPYFLGLKDFGYSKSADEALKFWGHQEALRRMVLKIRELRPDVIITNHDTTSGHGHHQATGRLALEAFDAAADPSRFPEQLPRAGVWQVKRLFVRQRRSADTTNSEKLVVIDPNEVDSVRGSSYGEQALLALQQHASQGPWPPNVSAWLRAQNNQTGKLSLIRYGLAKQTPDLPVSPNSYSGVPFVEGMQLPQEVANYFKSPPIEGVDLTSLEPDPEAVLEALIQWRKNISSTQQPNADPARFAHLNSRLNFALATASALRLSVASSLGALLPGSTDRVTVKLINEGTRSVRIHSLRFSAWDMRLLKTAEQLLPDTETTVDVDVGVPKDEALTVPKAAHLYDKLFKGKPLAAEAEVEIEGGARFTLRQEIDLDIAPAIEITRISPDPYVLTPGTINKAIRFQVELKNNTKEPFRGVLKLSSPALRIFEFGKSISLQPSESQAITLRPNATFTSRRRGVLVSPVVRLSVEGANTSEHVTERQVKVLQIDARVPRGLLVGYVPSFDRTLETALASLGVEAQSLTMADVTSLELSKFDTIVIDNRGYEAHPELVANNSRLLQYVADGGTLLVFYQRNGDWNPDDRRGRTQLAPHPIILGDDRVTEEDAAVTFRQPRHRLLNYPNRITSRDFENWVQERGLFYPKEWDPKYQMLFSMHDSGEKPLYGGLLTARYGKGNYIYTSMVWYRQLRAGIPGGYRMFANLISYGK